MTATAKQIKFMDDLAAQLIEALAATTDEEIITAGVTLADVMDTCITDPALASKWIDSTKALLHKSKRETVVVKNADAPEGMHKFGGIIFKVQRSQTSGRMYAKALVESGSGRWTFEYAAGAVYNLSERTRLSLEEAKQFGQRFGTCCVCGRLLTNPTSVAEGIGPVCGNRI